MTMYQYHLLSMFASLLLFLLPTPSLAEFNFEVGLRVHERLTEYMTTPAAILDFVSNYRSNGMIRTSDRNAMVRLGDALMKTHPHWMIYYGLESGELAGVFHTPRFGNYREPGNGAYEVFGDGDGGGNTSANVFDINNGNENSKHYMTCVDEVGGETPCLMGVGDPYIDCIDNCSLQKCQDEDSQRDCSILPEADQASCEASVSWCESYEIKNVLEDDGPRGFVPLSYYCLDEMGLPTQELDGTYEFHDSGPGNCYYDDGVTLVDRSLTSGFGEFHYCAVENTKNECSDDDDGDSPSCNTTFVGAFRSSNYDPRYRPWYIKAKTVQKPYWTSAFMFWQSTDMGITFVKPMHKLDSEGRKVFEGVLALDYKFTDIGNFLSGSYKERDTVIVAIVEEAAPHYVIATSTGGIGAKTVYDDDLTKPCVAECTDNAQRCNVTDLPDCVSVRVEVGEMDNAVSEAFAAQVGAGFPETELVPVAFGDEIYASQTKPFEMASDGVSWRIMILSPIETRSEDAIELGDPLVPFIIVPVIFGVIVCSVGLIYFVTHRHRREIVYSDWRFTSAFMSNCILLNLSCLSLIGENNDALCLLRMWVLHFFFVLTLAPLFVKTYRMYLLVGKPMARRTVSHKQTALMMVPFVLVEVAILVIFTFVDPSKQTSLIEQDGSTVDYRVICGHDTIAFTIVQLTYEGGLLLVGCVLAFKTRHLKEDFGESKQLILAMYNIALISSIIIILGFVADLNGQLRILVTVSICWSTIFSSGVFVLPRLLQVQQAPANRARSTIHMSAPQQSNLSNPTRASNLSNLNASSGASRHGTGSV